LFCLLILDGALDGLQISVRFLPLILTSMIVTIGSFIVLIAALIRQHESGLRLAVRRLAWSAAVFMAISFFLSNANEMVESIRYGSRGQKYSQTQRLRDLAKQKPSDNPFLLADLVFEGLLSLGIGVSGLLLMRGGAAGSPSSESPSETPTSSNSDDVPPPPPPTNEKPAPPTEPGIAQGIPRDPSP
jgi:hypothetical protein